MRERVVPQMANGFACYFHLKLGFTWAYLNDNGKKPRGKVNEDGGERSHSDKLEVREPRKLQVTNEPGMLFSPTLLDGGVTSDRFTQSHSSCWWVHRKLMRKEL